LTGKRSSYGRKLAGLVLAALGLLFSSCRQDMHDQPRIEAFEENAFFADGVGSRPIPAGTVARGNLREDTHLYQGVDAEGNVLDTLPASLGLTPELLWRGKDRFEIYCSVCHGSTGAGDGMIVRRGFKQPPPLWEDRLVNLPLGYFYDVMTNGYGVMSSYAKQVPVHDRWAIAAYIRALQFSQGSRLEALPTEVQEDFHKAFEASATGGHDEDGHREDGHREDGHREDGGEHH